MVKILQCVQEMNTGIYRWLVTLGLLIDVIQTRRPPHPTTTFLADSKKETVHSIHLTSFR
jgi:hypothetical protein